MESRYNHAVSMCDELERIVAEMKEALLDDNDGETALVMADTLGEVLTKTITIIEHAISRGRD